MANELYLSITSRYKKGNASLPQRLITKGITVAGTLVAEGVISIDTTETQIPTDGFTLTGVLVLQNLDGTNYIEVGGSTGVYTIKAEAGEPAALRMNNWTGIYAKAHTAACLVQYRIFSA